MAYTYTDLKKHLRAMFGHGQSNVSGDGGGTVVDHAGRLSRRPVQTRFNGTASATSLFNMVPIYVAQEESDVHSIRIAISAALTLTATDYVNLTVLKRKSATWSVTESVATLAFGKTSTWSTNIAGMSKAFTLATTAAAIDMDPGDTLCLNGTLQGANAIGMPECIVSVEYEEK